MPAGNQDFPLPSRRRGLRQFAQHTDPNEGGNEVINRQIHALISVCRRSLPTDGVFGKDGTAEKPRPVLIFNDQRYTPLNVRSAMGADELIFLLF